MNATRREFLRLGLGASTLLASGTGIPTFLARSASALAASPKDPRGRVLVVVQLDGGNDGLNTVVPYTDVDYAKHRPKLAVLNKDLCKLDDRVALHPSCVRMKKLFDENRLAVVQSVGYPNPNRSHFESMAIWHSARLKPSASIPGWLTPYLDRLADVPGGDAPALHIGREAVPAALLGSQQQVPSMADLEQFRRRLGMAEGPAAAEQRAALDVLADPLGGDPDSLLQFVQRSTLVTYASSARLAGILVANPERQAPFGLAQRLLLIAQLIKAGLSTSIYYTSLGGFDTHSKQLSSHPFLLRELSESLGAFLDDLTRSGEADRILILVFSEFGRRLHENASAGTDHGTAAPVFLMGQTVKGGVHGSPPNLQDLDAGGDPKFAIDFRRVYASVLESWLHCPSERVLGGKFEPIPVLA